mmetsp:Transcript_31003/g.47934  ORF Transcript_31003/g.47934 Transcript_31003/m.47934 type:complete len:98 (-) Transcript_31003:31-324(-)
MHPTERGSTAGRPAGIEQQEIIRSSASPDTADRNSGGRSGGPGGAGRRSTTPRTSGEAPTGGGAGSRRGLAGDGRVPGPSWVDGPPPPPVDAHRSPP